MRNTILKKHLVAPPSISEKESIRQTIPFDTWGLSVRKYPVPCIRIGIGWRADWRPNAITITFLLLPFEMFSRTSYSKEFTANSPHLSLKITPRSINTLIYNLNFIILRNFFIWHLDYTALLISCIIPGNIIIPQLYLRLK